MPKDQNTTTSKTKTIDDSQSKILKNLSARLTDDYFNKKNFPLRTAGASSQDEALHIDEFIKQSARKLAGDDDKKDERRSTISPQKFNGISSIDEERTLLKEQLKHLERENLKLKHELDLLKNSSMCLITYSGPVGTWSEPAGNGLRRSDRTAPRNDYSIPCPNGN